MKFLLETEDLTRTRTKFTVLTILLLPRCRPESRNRWVAVH